MSCSSTSTWVVFVSVHYSSSLLVSPHLCRAAGAIFLCLTFFKKHGGSSCVILVVKDKAFLQGARVGCAVCSGFRTSVDGTVFLMTGERIIEV